MARNLKAMSDAQIEICMDAILEEYLLSNSKTITRLCEDNGFSVGSFFKYVGVRPDWKEAWEEGKLARAQCAMDRNEEIANLTADNAEESGLILDPKILSLQAATNRDLAAKYNPRQYGEASVRHILDVSNQESPSIADLLTDLTDIVSGLLEAPPLALNDVGLKPPVVDAEFAEVEDEDGDD